MEYHVIRLLVILHDCPVGKNVTSEQANEASALRSLPLISLALHFFQAWIYDFKGNVHSQSFGAREKLPGDEVDVLYSSHFRLPIGKRRNHGNLIVFLTEHA